MLRSLEPVILGEDPRDINRLFRKLQRAASDISLALYLTAPPDLDLTADLTEMPPDSTQVAEILPLLREFSAAVDLHGIWLTAHHSYDEEIDQLHNPLTQ